MQTDHMAAREKVLVARAQAGDEKALAELFLASDGRVRSVYTYQAPEAMKLREAAVSL